jgi:hypothetical protein
MLQEYYLKPQTEAMPKHWRSTLDGIFDNTRVVNSPSWIVRAFNERDRLYQSLSIVAVQTDKGKFCDAVTTLFENVYEGEPPSMSVDVFYISFITPNFKESSRLFRQIFHESLLFNRYAAVEALEKAHYQLVAEVKGITKDFVKTVNSMIQQSALPASLSALPAKQENLIAEDATPPPPDAEAMLPPIVIAAFRKALEDYKARPGRRRNDALPKRMDVYLLKASGEPYSDIQEKYQDENIARMLQDAIEKDIPKLKKLYPESVGKL